MADCFLTTPLSLPSRGCQPKLGGHQQLRFLSEDRDLSPCPSSRPPPSSQNRAFLFPYPSFFCRPSSSARTVEGLLLRGRREWCHSASREDKCP